MFKLILFIFITTSGYSVELEKKIPKPEIIKELLPLEFEMIFNYIRKKLPKSRRLEFLKLTHELNTNFKRVPRENLFFFIKAEVYRSLIQYEFDTYIQQIDINPTFLQKLDQKLQASKILYDDFAVWLITSLINDFDPYLNSPVFQNLGQKKASSEDDMKLANEIKRKLKYLNKWFYVADKYDPERFSELTYEVCWTVLNNLKSYMEVLGFFSGRIHLEKPPEYFKLPALEEFLPAQNTISNFEKLIDESQINTLENVAMEEAAKAKNIVGKIQVPLAIPAQVDPAATGPVLDDGQSILGGGYQAYDPNNDYLQVPMQNEQIPMRAIDPQTGEQIAGPAGDVPWIPDEYGDQLNNLPMQDANIIDTPDGKRYKDGVYIVPHGGKKSNSNADPADDGLDDMDTDE